jgi:8-oxo-dGTP diphosphatase
MRLAVDAVIFGYVEKDLKILLIKRKYEPFQDSWALPGGFVLDDESINTAVERELKEETGLENIYMEQLYTFGEVYRDPRERIVSVAYYGLVNPDRCNLCAKTDASDVQWFSLKKLPKIAFDHIGIIKVAYNRLQGKVTYQPIGFELLPSKFPFSQLQSLYETILDRNFDRRNFRKKFISLDIIDQLNEKQVDVPYKAGSLFKFNKKKYEEKLNNGFYFEI